VASAQEFPSLTLIANIMPRYSTYLLPQRWHFLALVEISSEI
jgi:hypothetical protein